MYIHYYEMVKDKQINIRTTNEEKRLFKKFGISPTEVIRKKANQLRVEESKIKSSESIEKELKEKTSELNFIKRRRKQKNV